MHEVGSIDFSLNELARRSRVSKPNIYRYFESREHVLLQLWIEEIRELSERLALAFAELPSGDLRATASAVARTFAERPELGELTSTVSPVLERNLSVDAIVGAKRTLAELNVRIAGLLHDRLPAIPLGDCVWTGAVIGTYVAGIWPSAHPHPAAREALARPELAGMQTVFERDFTRFLEVLLRGLVHAQEPAANDANDG